MGDVIVIGGGPNGLGAAITLARAGESVTLLEARDALGGRLSSDEFHPGYHSLGLLHDTSQVQPWVTDALGLDLTWRDAPDIVAPNDDGGHTVARDDAALAAWTGEVECVAPLVRSLARSAPPDIRQDASLMSLLGPAIAALKLGRSRGLELARVGPMCAQDWLDEWGIDRRTQAILTLPALLGTWMAPRSPTSALAVLFHHALSGAEIVGGGPALLAALTQAANAAGVDIRTGSTVTGITVSDGGVTNVVLADGSTLDADRLVSTVGPRRTLLDLVDARQLPFRVDKAIRPVRTRGIVAKVDLALSAPLFDGHERVVVAEDTVAIEKAFDDAKHRRMPTAPVLDIRQSTGDHPVASVIVFGVAHDLDGGWTDERRSALGDTVRSSLSRFTDTAGIVAQRVQTPADLAVAYGLDGGHIFHGEFALDQMLSFRPHPTLAGYATPIRGLFLGSAGMHPAGGFTGAQGVLAAGAVLGR